DCRRRYAKNRTARATLLLDSGARLTLHVPGKTDSRRRGSTTVRVVITVAAATARCRPASSGPKEAKLLPNQNRQVAPMELSGPPPRLGTKSYGRTWVI